MLSFLSRERTIAPPGFSRWLVPPSAIAVHMCIGEIYGFSVFNLPLSHELGTSVKHVVLVTYSLGLVMLGLSAAFLGKWVERVGPRRTMFTAAGCFCGGLVVASVGVHLRSLPVIALGYGVIGGIGLGLGYIAPVSTLVKWFPDKPGMATGFAIMGFGSGALVGAPFAVRLMSAFKKGATPGVGHAFLVMAACYFVMMCFGAVIVRVPAANWRPEGYVPGKSVRRLVTNHQVEADEAMKTPQFYLLWFVLCCNVTAGIGILGQASPMAQEMFGISAAAAAGFVGFLSIFNMAGRFIWSSVSDYTGRKVIYCVYFLLGCALYWLVPATERVGGVALFVLMMCVVISMYGGGFSTIPAYLRDLFGTVQVGAIHGRVITAWSAAAVLGPQLITYLSEYQRSHGVPRNEAYNSTLHIMAGILVVGLICNLCVRAVDPKHHQREEAAS